MNIFFSALLIFMSMVALAADPPKRELDLTKPFGSMENPVKTCMPDGQREYLMRLRCSTGEAPKFSRGGSMGPGPYGGVVDGYSVQCSGGDVSVIMDMYHCKQPREMKAVPGFTILADLPAKIAKGCPPAVPGEQLGKYAFNPLEVEKPVRRPPEINNPPKLGEGGRAYFNLVIDENGLPDPAAVELKFLQNESIRQRAIEFIKGVKFGPAIHHDACAVRQRIEVGVNFLPE